MIWLIKPYNSGFIKPVTARLAAGAATDTHEAMTAASPELIRFLSTAARKGKGLITREQLWQIKLMDTDEVTLQSVAMQIHHELLESADDAVNDAFSASFLDIVFGFTGPDYSLFSGFWDVHLLTLFDDYTRLAGELCESLSVQTGQLRPDDWQAHPDSYGWLGQGKTNVITDASGRNWRHDAHGGHIRFTCLADEENAMAGTGIEATLSHINHVDGGFFLGYIKSCPEHAAIALWFEENGLQRMTDLLSLYVRKGWLIQTPNHEYRRDLLAIAAASA